MYATRQGNPFEGIQSAEKSLQTLDYPVYFETRISQIVHRTS